MRFIRAFREVGMGDVGSVGRKNASLGEMLGKLGGLGIRVPDGFAVTADGYRHFLRETKLEDEIRATLAGVRKEDVADLTERSARIRRRILSAPLPADLEAEIKTAYERLSLAYEEESTDVAVRSSGTAEDLPTGSFAGQQESYLDVCGAAPVLEAVKKAFAGLFTPGAISHRLDLGFDTKQVALSVGIQKMVRSDLASSGVIFTLDPETGHRGFALVTSTFGFGESIVQGRALPDQFYVHKATLDYGFQPIVWKKLGTKEVRLVRAPGHGQVCSESVADVDRARFSLTDREVLKLARWAVQIEDHYSRLRGSSMPMAIEWAKDGRTGDLFILEARPETAGESLPAEITDLPRPHTRILLDVGHPEQAMKLSLLPSAGVGLARMEFIFAEWVGVHPLALTRYEQLPANVQREVDQLTHGYADKKIYFVDRLSQGIGTIAAAFWPREVVLRFSDFKTNEYARLLGGASFEPSEGNPVLGFRGASRYYHPDYKEGFLLEVTAVKRVREEFGLTNVKVMVPFCRTPEEGERVLETMAEGGLVRGKNSLEVYLMAEIPSNILLAERFARLFDGFSIGSKDLTQLTLGIDRDSTMVAPLFDERSEAVKWCCAHLIEVAHDAGRKVGICGQAPSDFPDFAAFLVERGIDSICVTPDALARTVTRVRQAEDRLPKHSRTYPPHSPVFQPPIRHTTGPAKSMEDAEDGDGCDDPA